MSDFKKSVTVVLEHEGGFVNNPADYGGATNMGLTLHDLHLAGLPDDIQTLKSLTPDQAQTIYYQVFWAPAHFDLLNSTELAIVLFDQGILDGIPRAVEALQGMLGSARDGDLGPETAAAANAQDGRELAFRFLSTRVHYYVEIARADLTQIEFLAGWVNRLLSLAKFLANT